MLFRGFEVRFGIFCEDVEKIGIEEIFNFVVKFDFCVIIPV